MVNAPLWALETGGRGGWVPGKFCRTVERGRRAGWYMVDFNGRPWQGRRRSRPVPVHPDKVKFADHGNRCTCGCVLKGNR